MEIILNILPYLILVLLLNPQDLTGQNRTFPLSADFSRKTHVTWLPTLTSRMLVCGYFYLEETVQDGLVVRNKSNLRHSTLRFFLQIKKDNYDFV